MAVNQNISHIRGDDFTYEITLTDSDREPLDITGYTGFFTVKSAYDEDITDASAVISEEWTSHTSPTTGVTTLSVAGATMKITAGDYYYDIQLVSGGGAITTTHYGVLTILSEATVRIS